MSETDVPLERRRTIEFGFLYDGVPEWSTHAHVGWHRDGAEHYRQDAIRWRDPAKVGGLVQRERVSFADSVGDWRPVDE